MANIPNNELSADSIAAAEEIKKLRNTIAVMRQELENIAGSKDRAVIQAHGQVQGEIIKLKKTIVALREQLEEREDLHKNALIDLKREHQKELEIMRDMVRGLRDKLEENNGSDR